MNESYFSASLPSAAVLDFSHSNRYMVKSHCFNFQFLMTDDVEHLFICLFDIHISPLVRYLFRYFVHFLFRLFVFLLMSFKACFFF